MPSPRDSSTGAAVAAERLGIIGVVAHIDAGKTTVSERVLFYTGVERRMGEVHEGTAVMDWMEEERKRGITITSAATAFHWRDHSVNLIDTPGHVDFTVEVERCMRVLDGAILVVNGVAGVQAQSETVWRQMMRYHVRALAFVNQLDRAGADFQRAVEDLRTRLEVPAIPIQYPVGAGREFRTVVVLVENVAWRFDESDLGREPVRLDVPAEVADEVGVLRSELVETLAEGDEELLNVFMDEGDPPPELLRRALRARVISGELVPVLCGAALRNVGIQPLLDAVVDYLPSPLEVPPVEGTDPATGEAVARPPEADGPLCALAFKLAADPHEDLTFTRVYSGQIRPGQKVFNPRVRRMERIARVLQMHADTKRPLDVAGPGAIVALTGLKHTGSGDTLGGHDDAVLLEATHTIEPVITKVVEPRATDDRDKLRSALDRLAFEDPSFRVREDEETGQWLIAGMGELHLEIKQHRLEEDFHLQVKVGQPRVAYREAVASAARASASVDRQLGGKDVFGRVEVEVRAESETAEAPSAKGQVVPPAATGLVVAWDEHCDIPEKFRPAVEDALHMGGQVGPRFGFPLSGATLRVLGHASPSEKESDLGYAQAAGMALRNALQEARVVLREPLMAFQIEAPAEFMSGIIGEMNAKRADIQGIQVEDTVGRVEGTVPLIHMFGYATTLRSLSKGRASFSLTPAGFQEVPEAELEQRGLVWT